MSQPSVTANELDGALGVLPSGSVALAYVGVADKGPTATPAAYGRTTALVTDFGGGPLIHAAARVIALGLPAIVVRTGQTTAATETTIDITGVTGTSVVSFSSDTTANDNYEPQFRVVGGGTIGVTGITYQYSLSGGRDWSPISGLGTANAFVFPNAGGINVAFAAGTLVAGDIVKFTTVAPSWNTTELGTALTALKNSVLAWDTCYIVGDTDGAAFDVIATQAATMPEKTFVCNFRNPTPGETESAYKTAYDAIFGSRSNSQIGVAAGAAQITSAIDFKQYRRPFGHAVAAELAQNSQEVDVSVIDLGALVGVQIRDANGNPLEHDESVNPGLDDSRAIVARTWADEQGVYINNPNLLSATGSDFQFIQHRRVFNIFKRVLRLYFQRRLSKSILVDKTTGFILESEALEIESGANAACRAALMAKPMASGGGFSGGGFVKLSRTDNLLSTKTVHVQGALVPLAYPKSIVIDEGFRNPALRVIGVGV